MVQDDSSTAATIATDKGESAHAKKADHNDKHSAVSTAEQKREGSFSYASSIMPEQQMAWSSPPLEQSDELQKLRKRVATVELAIQTYGPWDIRVANAFCTLGNLYNQLGMLPEALSMFEKDLQITRHSVHDSDLRVAGARYNVGMTACKLGRFPQALAYLEDALRARTAVLGPRHPEVADVLTCIGGVYSYTGRAAEALAKYEEAAAIRRAALGPGDPGLAQSLENAASVRCCLGQRDQVGAPSFRRRRAPAPAPPPTGVPNCSGPPPPGWGVARASGSESRQDAFPGAARARSVSSRSPGPG
jgi:Tfp pilus assembly protein PilF